MAARYCQVDVIKEILETDGIDKQRLFEIQNTSGSTVLHTVTYFDNVSLIKLMLETDGIDKQRSLEIQDRTGKTALHCAIKKGQVDVIKTLLEYQVSTLGLRGDEKEAIKFLKPENLREILKIKFSPELGEAGSTIRLERESLVLKAIYDHLKTNDINNPKAGSVSLNIMTNRVNVLSDEIGSAEGIAGSIIVQREIDKVMKQIMPKSRGQSAVIDHSKRYVQAHQNQNEHRR
jgi:ankyrin repeat protein